MINANDLLERYSVLSEAKCRPGFKMKLGRCLRMTSKEMNNRKLAAKKTAKKLRKPRRKITSSERKKVLAGAASGAAVGGAASGLAGAAVGSGVGSVTTRAYLDRKHKKKRKK